MRSLRKWQMRGSGSATGIRQHCPAAGGATSAVLMIALALSACGGHTVPPNLTPAGVRAWKAREAVVYVNTVVDATIGLNKVQVCDTTNAQCHPLLSDATTRPVLDGLDTTLALLDKAPDNWKSIALEGLTQAEAKLDAYGKTKLLPYIAAARAALATIQEDR